MRLLEKLSGDLSPTDVECVGKKLCMRLHVIVQNLYYLGSFHTQYEALLRDSLIQCTEENITMIRHHFQPPTLSELTVYARRTLCGSVKLPWLLP